MIVDALRPTFNLVLMAYFIAQGRGVKGAIMGAAIGTSAGGARSASSCWSAASGGVRVREVGLIVKRGFCRMPIAMSMCTIQNADGFMLSRFVDHKQIGYYKLAQKLGFVVSFLPQGFRIALRPLRKTAMFQAVSDQYGSAVAQGQLLIYFFLVAIVAILAMVLGGELLINIAGPVPGGGADDPADRGDDVDAGPLPDGQRVGHSAQAAPGSSAAVFAGLTFVGWMMLLVPTVGIAGAPIA